MHQYGDFFNPFFLPITQQLSCHFFTKKTKAMLNITEKRILKKQLQKLQKGWGRTLDKSSENRQITQLQIKRIAKQNYQLNKSIDIILKLM